MYLPGRDPPEESLTRCDVFGRLEKEHPSGRPTDSSEFAHTLTRRAEQLRKDGHPTEAFDALCEARYVLEPVLNIGRPELRLPYFDDDLATMRWERLRQGRFGRGESCYQTYNPKAYDLNFLGKSYRLYCELILDQKHGNLDHSLGRAENHLQPASVADRLLPYPYAHRLDLASDGRLPGSDRAGLLESVRHELESLADSPESKSLRDNLSGRYPVLTASAARRLGQVAIARRSPN